MNTLKFKFKHFALISLFAMVSCNPHYEVLKWGGASKGIKSHNAYYELFVQNNDPQYSLEKVVAFARNSGFLKEDMYGIVGIGKNLIYTKGERECRLKIDTINKEKIYVSFFSIKNSPSGFEKKQFIVLSDSVYNIIEKEYYN